MQETEAHTRTHTHTCTPLVNSLNSVLFDSKASEDFYQKRGNTGSIEEALWNGNTSGQKLQQAFQEETARDFIPLIPMANTEIADSWTEFLLIKYSATKIHEY